MGVFRLLLSAIVVMFHFGGYGPLAGRASVFTFFCISGYLMALVIERVYGYRPGGVLRFYVNRALRLVPLYMLYVALTLIALSARGEIGFLIDPNEPLWLDVHRQSGGLGTGAQLAPSWVDGWPVLTADVVLLPQTWSLLIEACFYVCAPLLALLWRRALPLFILVAAGSAAISVGVLRADLDFDVLVYKNYWAALWVFQLGMVLYYLRRHLGERVPRKPLVALVLVLVYWQIVVRSPDLDVETGFYLSVALSGVLVVVLGSARKWPNWFTRIDKYAGDLAYGVFVNHYFAALVLLELNEAIFTRRGSFDFFGRLNQPLFGMWTVVVSIGLAYLTFQLLERPLQRSRDRVRGVMISPAPELPVIEPQPRQVPAQ